jgi:PAS domain S-box-containing protein
MEKLFGLPAAKLIGRTDDDLFGKEAGAHTREVDSRVLGGRIVEEEHTKPVEGVPTTFHVIKVPMRGQSGEIIGVCGIARDITERNQAEKALRESEEQLRTLIDAMPDFVCFKDGDGRWLNVNDASIRLFQLDGMNYRGKTDSELAELNSFLRGAFLTCEKSDANTWEKRSTFRGEETLSLHDGMVRVFDVIKAPVFYPSGERKGLVVLITLAETVSRIFSLRNPYVATHQQETAKLARAVGEKMGLDKDRLQNLYIGSLLHDIGKTAIPEGILRKPGKLSKAEWGLVRALHHHERLDGSGYPDGLKGDELSTEVRILAVCNVVNAMSLRHPYRPARSKQEITKEITNGKGTRYDPDVVDVLVEMIESGELELAG